MTTKAGRVQLKEIRAGLVAYMVDDIPYDPQLSKIIITDYYKDIGRVRFRWTQVIENGNFEHLSLKQLESTQDPIMSMMNMVRRPIRGIGHLKLATLVCFNGTNLDKMGQHLFATQKAALRYMAEQHETRQIRMKLREHKLYQANLDSRLMVGRDKARALELVEKFRNSVPQQTDTPEELENKIGLMTSMIANSAVEQVLDEEREFPLPKFSNNQARLEASIGALYFPEMEDPPILQDHPDRRDVVIGQIGFNPDIEFEEMGSGVGISNLANNKGKESEINKVHEVDTSELFRVNKLKEEPPKE